MGDFHSDSLGEYKVLACNNKTYPSTTEAMRFNWLIKENATKGTVWVLADVPKISEADETRLRQLVEEKTSGRVKAGQLNMVEQKATTSEE